MRKKDSITHNALALLLGFFRSQSLEIGKIYRNIRGRSALTRKEESAYLGYLLHNLYCAFEDLFKEIAKTFENRIEDPQRYHRELLKRMSFEVPGIRPAVLSELSYLLLDELRSFRHVFRHAYAHELNLDQLEALKSKISKGWKRLETDLQNFEGRLKRKLK